MRLNNLKGNNFIIKSPKEFGDLELIYTSPIALTGVLDTMSSNGTDQMVMSFNTNGSGVLSTIDGGLSFQTIPTNNYTNSARVYFANDRFFVGGDGGTGSRFCSILDGSYVAVTTVTGSFSGYASAYGNGMYACGILGTSPNVYTGSSATSLSGKNVSGILAYMTFVEDRFIYGFTDTYYSTTDFNTTNLLPTPPYSISYLTNFGDDKLYAIAYNNPTHRLLVSYDKGQTWNVLFENNSANGGLRGVTKVNNKLVIATNKDLRVSDNNGLTFKTVETGITNINGLSKMGNNLIIRTTNNLYKMKVM